MVTTWEMLHVISVRSQVMYLLTYLPVSSSSFPRRGGACPPSTFQRLTPSSSGLKSHCRHFPLHPWENCITHSYTQAVLALFSPAAAHDLPLPSPMFRFAFLVAAHLFDSDYRRWKESNRELNLLGTISSSSLLYVQGHSTNV